jgi:hypothetical protein
MFFDQEPNVRIVPHETNVIAMTQHTNKIAKLLAAEVIGGLPKTGGGAFGAARVAGMVDELRHGLEPGRGRRPGRPTNPKWARHPKVPISDQTLMKLRHLAEQSSTAGRKISPMQIAAHLLEAAVTHCSKD